MNDQRLEIARLSFSGQHYDAGVVDAAVFVELLCFQKILTEMAKSVWKKQNPERERLPRDFDDRTRFVFRSVESGNTVISLGVPQNSNQILPLFGYSDDVIKKAVELTYNTFVAADCGRILPSDVPRDLIPSLSRLGGNLPGDAEMQFAAPKREMRPVSLEARWMLKSLVGDPYEDEIEITGRVLEADVRKRRFQVWMDDQTNATVNFMENQESEVITALREHASMRLSVKGRGKFSKEGTLQQVHNVEYLKVIPDNRTEFDMSASCIEDTISEVFNNVPDHEWDEVPSDLSHRHDFYLYGDGKR